MKKKTVYILRGVSGAGKSTLAESLIVGRNGVICTADDFFMVDGEYKFDATKIGRAHQTCKNKFIEALTDEHVEVIVVANTNTKTKDFSEYQDNCYLYSENVDKVHYLVIENRHGNKDVHNVPEGTRKMQSDNIKNSLKLI